MRALEGAVSAQKALQRSKIETRELLEELKEIVFPRTVGNFLPKNSQETKENFSSQTCDPSGEESDQIIDEALKRAMSPKETSKSDNFLDTSKESVDEATQVCSLNYMFALLRLLCMLFRNRHYEVRSYSVD